MLTVLLYVQTNFAGKLFTHGPSAALRGREAFAAAQARFRLFAPSFQGQVRVPGDDRQGNNWAWSGRCGENFSCEIPVSS